MLSVSLIRKVSLFQPTGGAICTSKPEGELHGIPSPRMGGNGMSESYMRQHMPGGYDGGEPHEAVMKKGDAMFWHHWCVRECSNGRLGL
eukprot:COSAG04_NODE_1625_length_6126_cov_7.367679_5_plen_89_part_00